LIVSPVAGLVVAIAMGSPLWAVAYPILA
jgi:hypothetical protein